MAPKTPANPAAAKKTAEAEGTSPAPPKPAHRGNLIPMVVVSDAACALEVNGDPIGALEPGAVKKLSVYPGDQLVKCASTEEPGEIYSAVQNIKAGEQTVLQIGLAARIASAREKREAQVQSLAAEDALWAQAGQHGSAANLQAYLDKYPNGRFAEQARQSLTEASRHAEAAPRPAETASQPAEAASQPAEAAPQPAETASQPAEVAPQPAEAASQPAEATPQPAEAAPQPAEATPQPTEAAPQPAQAVPPAAQVLPPAADPPHRTRRVTVALSSTVHGEPV